ncbi:MAG: hypothetical protein HY651_11225 [Acidobacteria bacterium]|nr:hypothetical protein [Acidobacteriota bacterium]
MTRVRLNVAAMLALFAFTLGISAFGQDLFEGYKAEPKDAPLTDEQKAAGEKESIF